MAEDQLRTVLDGISTRIQAELQSQFGALTDRHTQALEQVRRDASAEADARYASRLDAAQAEWSARLQAEVQAARSEVERKMVAESMRARVEAEQAATDAAARARQDLEEALAGAAARANAQVEQAVAAERQRSQAEIHAERQRIQQELSAARAALDAERARAAATVQQLAGADAGSSARVLDAVRAIDGARSLSDALNALVRGAAREASRAALFIVNGSELHEWPVPGVPSLCSRAMRADSAETGLIGDALRGLEPVSTGIGATGPSFAALPKGRAALAVPVVLDRRPVAVLYADEGTNGAPPAAWQQLIQILGRHAAAYTGYLTALRTAQAMRFVAGASDAGSGEPGAGSEQEQAARRYARLLVSEIKLYNESAVRAGRERRDLLQRLKPEIERARRLYDERVAASITSRDLYFQQELVQTLADGDRSLLG